MTAPTSAPQVELLPWPTREVVAREVRRAMLDNPTDESFNKRAENREAIANDVADVILARFALSIRPQASAGDRAALNEILKHVRAPNRIASERLDRIEAICVAALAHESMASLGASEVACYRWPEDTAEHRAMRAAFCDGAGYIAQASAGERGTTGLGLNGKPQDTTDPLEPIAGVSATLEPGRGK